MPEPGYGSHPTQTHDPRHLKKPANRRHMMKKIALVELQEHQEVLFGLMELLLLKEVELRIFAPQAMHQEWEITHQEQVIWYDKKEQESIPNFIKRSKTALDAVDLIIFTTLVSHFSFFARQKFQAQTLLLVHKGNAFFVPRAHLQLQSVKDVLRYLRRIWRREDFYRQQFLSQVSACSFTDVAIQAHLQSVIPSVYKILPALPFSYFEPTEIRTQTQVRIVVPGTVSDFTRDYTLLFEALQMADSQLNHRAQVIFLGQASGKRARTFFDLLHVHSFQNFSLQTYGKLVPAQEYQHILQQSDFLILPLRAQIRFGLIREYYGKTSISGGINDLLRYGKPTLLPAFYPLSSTLDILTQRYQNAEELADLLIGWINQRAYRSLAEQAASQLAIYAKSQQSQRLWEILEPLL